MSAVKNKRNLIVSRFEEDQKIFYLKSEGDEREEQAVSCNLKLKGKINGIDKSVNTELPLTDYKIIRFTNPYLNAENDSFKIKLVEKTIGYIFPFSAIEDGESSDSEKFDEALQAYKYYCAKAILEMTSFDNEASSEPIQFSSIENGNSIFAIIYCPIAGADFIIEDYLPSFALKGYYFYPPNLNPNVLSLTLERQTDAEVNSLIQARFLNNRNNESIKLQRSKDIVLQNPLIGLLYKKLLVENGNPLHRFLILYQVIEFLVDKRFRVDVEEVLNNKHNMTNFKFVQRINELNSTRSTINKLFEEVQFEEKIEITNALRNFILIFDTDFKSQATGDCLYDIRNLLFHDFKSVLEKNKDGEVASLVIQFEILIHQLLISVGKAA